MPEKSERLGGPLERQRCPAHAEELHFPQACARDSISHNSCSASGAADVPWTVSGFGPGAGVEAAAAAAEWDTGGGSWGTGMDVSGQETDWRSAAFRQKLISQM